MTRTPLPFTPALADYLATVGYRESPILAEVRRHADTLPNPNLQIAPEQGALLAFLVRLMGAKRVLEVGVFTGYSSLAMAEALPPEGRLTAVDNDPVATETAQAFWRKAGVAGRMELRLGLAAEVLETLAAEGREGYYDFAFLDADKEGYGAYLDQCLRLLRPGGVIAVDNVLWRGAVADPSHEDAETQALRQFNAAVAQRQNLTFVLVPIGDGLTLIRKSGTFVPPRSAGSAL